MSHLTYAIVDVATDLPNIDFSQIGETSSSTIRKSIDETLFIIKWNTEPTFIANGTVIPSLILTHSEALTEMATPAWSEPVPA
ncbi:hypothetical protein CMI47_10900 [Candidatus Pacearchaeota archaeon]|jgi:hypothetical protein|nr:hypothetical protein [Candidatus Pacearchaeota archaeon]|tara:strand:- start:16021 stop:16269 length:249 start_codon:yes stop_codon:yes gene_type:complete